jgi:UDP-N-acetylmuramyl pentapeptide phosphotransferase/UDP-N-acetylglucosamine-1-phosphate transferase
MMSLLFLLILLAMVALMRGRMRAAYGCLTVGLLLSLFWFNHHIGQQLSIVL